MKGYTMVNVARLNIAAVLLIIGAFNIAAYCVETPRPQNEVFEISSDLQLFVDDGLIASMNGASLKMHSPERREIVFVFDAPWEDIQSGYVAILGDEKIYKMYYCGGGDLTAEHTCLAESLDGIVWNRPEAGMID